MFLPKLFLYMADLFPFYREFFIFVAEEHTLDWPAGYDSIWSTTWQLTCYWCSSIWLGIIFCDIFLEDFIMSTKYLQLKTFLEQKLLNVDDLNVVSEFFLTIPMFILTDLECQDYDGDEAEVIDEFLIADDTYILNTMELPWKRF